LGFEWQEVEVTLEEMGEAGMELQMTTLESSSVISLNPKI
jgi:hypothetical protein